MTTTTTTTISTNGGQSSTNANSNTPASSLFSDTPKDHNINAICIGSGRFLRAVLVPALVATGTLRPVIIQTRGRSFMDYCASRPALGCKSGGNSNDNSSNSTSNSNGGMDENADANLGQRWTYEVDTVQHDGSVQTDTIPCWGAGTLGSTEGKQDVLTQLVPQVAWDLSLIGMGVTEAGLSSCDTKAMKDLYDLLYAIFQCRIKEQNGSDGNTNGKKICIINTDNVPNNGSCIQQFLMELVERQKEEKGIDAFKAFLTQEVSFHNTMVDRITSQRPNSHGMVPRAEPTPAKALVLEDLGGDLPPALSSKGLHDGYGVVVRTKADALKADIALKLRVANGTHTALAHVMALCGMVMTDVLSNTKEEGSILLMKYLDSFFEHQIARAVEGNDMSMTVDDARDVYRDWRGRLMHAHFGLSTFFITQNGAAKGGIRIGPTIVDLMACGGGEVPVSCATIFALAAILRFLTPAAADSPKEGVYRGWLDGSSRNAGGGEEGGESVEYADGLSYSLKEGWYEFRCACNVDATGDDSSTPLPVALGSLFSPDGSVQQPPHYEETIRAYLTKSDGGDLSKVAADHPSSFDTLVKAVSTLYARMVAGDGMMKILGEIDLDASCGVLVDGNGTLVQVNNSKKRSNSHLDHYSSYRQLSKPLHYRQSPIPNDSKLLDASLGDDVDVIHSVVYSEVQSAMTIDLHTHLLPPSHGALCLWGIDELLTYHYLVAEYFMTAPPSVTPENFYAQSKQKQADMIWEALFLQRSPVSEACRGVITTLMALGLRDEVLARDLNGIRSFYKGFRDDGVDGAERYSALVYRKAGVRYAVMTNIPFDPTETQHWRPKPKEYSSNFRAALRVDPLLAGDKKAIENALAVAGYSNTLEGARQYLHDWCDTMKPEYMMASTPHDFVLPEDQGTVVKGRNGSKIGVNEDALQQPFAFTDLTSNNCITDCDGGEDTLASIIDEDSDFLTEVLMKVCEERDLPIALKIGAHRKVNPSLLQAGDGLVAFADANILARLCTRFPKVRFLATFLSRNNQHEACVLASKFRNLHIYGCWWFCNNPSIIEEITKMRVEMLGSAFTAQHSDSRVLDQLIYKWSHSRAVIASVLAQEYMKLVETGWRMNRRELRRDIQRLFGASYEEFMSKSLT